jgi:hypothetical protein
LPHCTVVEVAVAVFEIAVNAAIAFVVFVAIIVVNVIVVVIAAVVVAVISAAVVVVISAIVVVIAVECFYSSYLLDVDCCEWKNGVSMLLLCFTLIVLHGFKRLASASENHWD